LTTAHGFNSASDSRTERASAMSISRRESNWYETPRPSQTRANARPSVPVAPVMTTGRAAARAVSKPRAAGASRPLARRTGL
jgi:hypothetical protein